MKQENVAMIEEHSENKRLLDLKKEGEGIKGKENKEEREEEDREKER